ncbi:MAG: glycosyltransferase [Bacteroidetes bacterium]|nr:glycosyltransferase [Bacteroidota bacterium]
MREIKEITVFCLGNSEEKRTWSNIPYFLTHHLQSGGIRVNRVDISPSAKTEAWFDRLVEKTLKRLLPSTTYCYFRSGFNYCHQRSVIKRASGAFPNADVNLFLTFSFSSAGLIKKPVVLLCDWTYEHYIHHYKKRNPDSWEMGCVKRETKQIENADLVISLFRGITDQLKEKYINPDIYYLGHVINSGYHFAEDDILKRKSGSHSLLFTGTIKYKEGAIQLIRAFEQIQGEFPDYKLHIVGIEKEELGLVPLNVYCHGYLDKGDPEQEKQYYSLLENASVFVNTTPLWAGFSACTEAMYYYTPVIVSRTVEFTRSFGDSLSFGYYCDSSVNLLSHLLADLLQDNQYLTLCRQAHEAVKEWTWEKYIDKLVRLMEEKL